MSCLLDIPAADVVRAALDMLGVSTR